VFENTVLRKILGPKREQVTGDWRKLHPKNIMICILYQNVWVIKLKQIRWACIREKRCMVLVGK
jgi:hypothetical protein